MNTVPFEILEEIIAYIPTKDLFSLCHTDRTLFKLVRHEAYKRWNQCVIKYGELFKEEQDLSWNGEPDEGPVWSILYGKIHTIWANAITVEQELLLIMEKMKNHSMIIDEQEKRIIDYYINIARYSSNDWRLNWSWCYAEWSEDSAS